MGMPRQQFWPGCGEAAARRGAGLPGRQRRRRWRRRCGGCATRGAVAALGPRKDLIPTRRWSAPGGCLLRRRQRRGPWSCCLHSALCLRARWLPARRPSGRPCCSPTCSRDALLCCLRSWPPVLCLLLLVQPQGPCLQRNQATSDRHAAKGRCARHCFKKPNSSSKVHQRTACSTLHAPTYCQRSTAQHRTLPINQAPTHCSPHILCRLRTRVLAPAQQSAIAPLHPPTLRDLLR